MDAILMTEEYWRNSHLSIAKYYGGIKINEQEYIIVNKMGKDLFHCSIAPGEPADLIRKDFHLLYRKLGREKFMELLKEHDDIETPKDMRRHLKEISNEKNN